MELKYFLEFLICIVLLWVKQCNSSTMELAFAIIFLVLFQIVFNHSDTNNYGPYKFDWQQIGACKGPKSASCGTFELENTQDPTDLIFRFDMPKDCPVTAAKIVVGNKHDNITKQLWNYVVNKPCQHFVLGPILSESFNLTSSCKINKGSYNIHINLVEKSLVFLGSNFFYGSYSFKVMSFNRAHNFFCVLSWVDIVKTT